MILRNGSKGIDKKVFDKCLLKVYVIQILGFYKRNNFFIEV
jgi:hypothetical protein